MFSRRKERLPQLLKKELSGIIQREGDIEPETLVTITKVELTDEGRRADIFLTIYPSTKDEEILSSLKKQERRLQLFLRERLKMQHVPILHIISDKGEKLRQRTEELFEKMKHKGE